MDLGTDSFVRIQEEPLSVEAAVDFLGRGDPGGVDLFLGITRRMTGHKETVHLEYDAYLEMAVTELNHIVANAAKSWPLERVYVAHRLGTVPVGQISVIVGASAKHRNEAFAASRYLIDTLKSEVPIWKKETYADGSTEWKPELAVHEPMRRSVGK